MPVGPKVGGLLFRLAVSAGNAEVVAGERKGFCRLGVLEAKARADVGAVDMPIHFMFFGDA